MSRATLTSEKLTETLHDVFHEEEKIPHLIVAHPEVIHRIEQKTWEETGELPQPEKDLMGVQMIARQVYVLNEEPAPAAIVSYDRHESRHFMDGDRYYIIIEDEIFTLPRERVQSILPDL